MDPYPIKKLKNVMYHPSSVYAWSELNETVFLGRLFLHLHECLRSDFFNFKFYIFSSHDPEAKAAPVWQKDDKKNILIWISEETGADPSHLAGSWDFIFKAYINADLPKNRIYSLPIGYVNEVPCLHNTKTLDRPIGIFFSGNLNTARIPLFYAANPRARLIPRSLAPILFRVFQKFVGPRFPASTEIKQQRSAIFFSTQFKGGMDPSAYAALLSSARIALCPPGFVSPITFRHTEALRAGAIVFSEPLPNTWPYSKSPIVEVPDWRQGLELADKLLDNHGDLQRLQEKSTRYYEDRLSAGGAASHMAKFIIGT